MLLYDYAPILTENNVRMSQDVNIIKSEMNDGYGATAPAGLNHIRKKANVVWKNVDKETKNNIISFFEERGGWKNFRWSSPSETESRLWKCEKWNFEPIAPDYYSVSSEFYEVFDLGEDY